MSLTPDSIRNYLAFSVYLSVIFGHWLTDYQGEIAHQILTLIHICWINPEEQLGILKKSKLITSICKDHCGKVWSWLDGNSGRNSTPKFGHRGIKISWNCYKINMFGYFNGFIEGCRNFNLLYVKWSNFWNTLTNFTKLTKMGFFWKSVCKISWKSVKNWLRNQQTTCNPSWSLLMWLWVDHNEKKNFKLPGTRVTSRLSLV